MFDLNKEFTISKCCSSFSHVFLVSETLDSLNTVVVAICLTVFPQSFPNLDFEYVSLLCFRPWCGSAFLHCPQKTLCYYVHVALETPQTQSHLCGESTCSPLSCLKYVWSVSEELMLWSCCYDKRWDL